MKASKDQTAPGDLEILRLFINTGDPENPAQEKLPGLVAAAAWLREHQLLDAHDNLDEAALERIIGLREAFRMELLAHTGDGDQQESWDLLSGFANMAELGIRSRETPGEIALAAKGQGAQYVAGRLFSIMYDAIRRNQWTRLKACRKDTCLFGFYDHSKNGSGVWCDMAVCGNRLKAQRRRQRAGAALERS
ncbi:MAG: CGNR zinc finger domain-containing protein [Candidatus Eremiobacteraeota bacterium]|nr:CGNR zinc finger domain-containing protein [Candidatus Eremiobacteraeota bacterium]